MLSKELVELVIISAGPHWRRLPVVRILEIRALLDLHFCSARLFESSGFLYT